VVFVQCGSCRETDLRRAVCGLRLSFLDHATRDPSLGFWSTASRDVPQGNRT
jgi:hypothetical protein